MGPIVKLSALIFIIPVEGGHLWNYNELDMYCLGGVKGTTSDTESSVGVHR